MREFFVEQLGVVPKRAPLKAKTVGKIDGDGYRIEKVIFESQPNQRITATLYLPNTNTANTLSFDTPKSRRVREAKLSDSPAPSPNHATPAVASNCQFLLAGPRTDRFTDRRFLP